MPTCLDVGPLIGSFGLFFTLFLSSSAPSHDRMSEVKGVANG